MDESTTQTGDKKLLKKDELAVRLQVTTRTVNNMMKKRLIPCIKLGTSKQGDVRFVYEDVVARPGMKVRSVNLALKQTATALVESRRRFSKSINVNDPATIATEGQGQPRGLPSQEKPYCWQSKAALRKIEGNPLSRNKAHTLLAYLAFTWIASDKQETTFQATKQFLCDKAGGIGRRTIEYALMSIAWSCLRPPRENPAKKPTLSILIRYYLYRI